jgi:hypothetical protein
MVSRFLLHDPSDMSIRGVSGERKFSVWGRVLEWHRRHQEAFCILEGLLSRSGPLQHFGPSLQKIRQRSQHLIPVRQEAAVKVYHAKKTLQMFDFLRGWAVFDFGSMIGRGAAPVAKIVCPRISREGAAKTHFSRLMARPLVAKAVKKASRWRRCVCLSGEPTRESSTYANTPSRPSVVRSIILWKVWAALDSPKGVNKYSNKPNSVMIAVFGMSSVATGIW